MSHYFDRPVFDGQFLLFFDENLNIVPTLQEAYDFIDMNSLLTRASALNYYEVAIIGTGKRTIR